MGYRLESVKPSIDSIIKRVVKVGVKVVYHARRWYVHGVSAFPLIHPVLSHSIRRNLPLGRQRNESTNSGDGGAS